MAPVAAEDEDRSADDQGAARGCGAAGGVEGRGEAGGREVGGEGGLYCGAEGGRCEGGEEGVRMVDCRGWTFEEKRETAEIGGEGFTCLHVIYEKHTK